MNVLVEHCKGEIEWAVPKQGADKWNYFESYDLIEGEFDTPQR